MVERNVHRGLYLSSMCLSRHAGRRPCSGRPRSAPPPMNSYPAASTTPLETVTFDEVDGHAVVRVETTFVVESPEDVAEVLQCVERRRLFADSSEGRLGYTAQA